MPAVKPDNGILVRLTSQPSVTKRALAQVYAFKFPDSPTPDYGLLSFFTGNDSPRKNIVPWQWKVTGNADDLTVGFYVTLTAMDEAGSVRIRNEFSGWARSVVENEPETLIWYFYEEKGTRTFHITTFFATREAADFHLSGPIPGKFTELVGDVFAVPGVLENLDVIDAWH